jgi:DNA polymerase III delta prime subunit
MLENIIGQTATIQTLRQELEDGCLPSALLFYGPPFSAKLSTALEVARALTCSEQALWSCTCASCRKHRLLVHPNTLLLGSRYFDLEIPAAADVLRRTGIASSQYLFIRAVRKLTRRFDPILWEGEEAKIRPLESSLMEIEDHLDSLVPASGGEQRICEQGLEEKLERVVSLCRGLSRQLGSDNVPVGQLRRASAWLHLTALAGTVPGGNIGPAAKIMILENADRMYDTSSNSLLKLLEEPPAGVCLILITTRRSAVIPTVVSRLRPYLFLERSREQEAEVLLRIFHEQREDYRSLREFFLYWKDVNPDQLRNLARRFIQEALAGSGVEAGPVPEMGILAEIAGLLSPNRARGFAASFLEEILHQLLPLLREGALSPFRLERWNRSIRSHQMAFNAFNQQPQLTLESLFYSLRTIR